VTRGTYQLYRGTTLIDSFTFNDQLGYGYTYYPSLSSGSYSLLFRASWTPYDVRDYTVSVYAADKIAITDSQGKTSFTEFKVRNLTEELLGSLSTALTQPSIFAYVDGGW
jgi:hypothetical protein